MFPAGVLMVKLVQIDINGNKRNLFNQLGLKK